MCTIVCINCFDLDENYIIFVTDSYLNAKKNGYDESNKSHKIIYWKKTNNYPLIIYREIRMNNEGIFSLTNNASEEEIQEVMGNYFPTTQFYKNWNCFL